MNIIMKALGSLPASSSAQGQLNSTYWLKMLRMGLVLVASYVVTAVGEALIRSVSNGEFGIPPELITPATGVLSLVLEGIRRKLAYPPKD